MNLRYALGMRAPRDVEPVWIPADQNAFHLRVMDCRPFTQTASAFSSNPQVAAAFVAARDSDGRQHRGRKPQDATSIPCRLSYTAAVNLSDGPVFRASEMEDKWDIDYFDANLYFSRSWSGVLVLVADVEKTNESLAISAVHANVKYPQSAVMFVRDVDFLVKTYIFGREAPHSLPPGLPSSEQAIATYSFSTFGRAAAFATYDDTTQVAI